jgi:hypothetical protein
VTEHFPTTPSKMSSPVSPKASGTRCQVLTFMKTLPLDTLLACARQYHTTLAEVDILETALRGILNEKDPSPMEHKIAELVYFRWGHMLVEQQQYNQMTRLQMEHECLVRALLRLEQLPATSNFGLKVLLRFDQEQILRAQNSVDSPPSPLDSGYNSGKESRDEQESDHSLDDREMADNDDNDSEPSLGSQDSDDDDRSKKAIYVTTWRPKLGRYVTFRY